MYNKTVLKNGARIITEKLDHFRSISLGIWVGTGSRDEMEEENGISHFIEHMIFKGTGRRNSQQIARELDAIGGFSDAFTCKEYTCFHSKVIDDHFPLLTDILSDIFFNSIYDPEEIAKEKEVIFQEINMVDDSPDEFIHDILCGLYWSDHPLGRSVLGTNHSVSQINRDGILNFIERFYTPDRIIISAAGNIDHDNLVSRFESILSSRNGTRFSIPANDPKIHSDVLSLYRKLEQVHICLGGSAPKLLDDIRFACAILNTILGGNMSSRLFQEIRERRGLAYSVYSFVNSYLDTGIFGVYAGTDKRNVNTVLGIINSEIKKIQDGEVTQDDVDQARDHLIGGILLGAESSDTRMLRHAKNEFLFGRHVGFKEVVENLKGVTLDEVVNCAKRAFRPNEVSLATLGPIRQDELDLDCMRFD
ncbi:MAG: insulinase family protein [Deltaproteobacteria bacterium]|nr:insulinase family protein [Deltaproteobacteria bacterium]